MTVLRNPTEGRVGSVYLAGSYNYVDNIRQRQIQNISGGLPKSSIRGRCKAKVLSLTIMLTMTTNMTMNTAQVFRPRQCEAHFHVHNIIKSNVSPPGGGCGQMSVLAGLLRIIIILTPTFNHCSSSRHAAAGATLAPTTDSKLQLSTLQHRV